MWSHTPGALIPREHQCNDIMNCPDGSDEAANACQSNLDPMDIPKEGTGN